MTISVTILGQGAMGSRMADRAEAAGFQVTRWNRTGAGTSPRDAVRGADIIIAMLRDDTASQAVWLGPDGALSGMEGKAIAIDSSTLTVEWVRTLAAAMEGAHRAFLDAPVLGSRPQAEAGQLVHLVGGDAAVLERASAVLRAIGAAQLHVGPVGSGAALKLVANTLFGIQVAAVAELLGRMPTLGLDAAHAISLLGQTPVMSPAAKGAAGLMLSDMHAPMFPIGLVAKDFGYAIGDHAETMPIASAAMQVFTTAADQGLNDVNLTAVATLYKG